MHWHLELHEKVYIIRYRLFILLFSRSLIVISITSHLPRGSSRHLGDVFISRLPFLKLIFPCKFELDRVLGGRSLCGVGVS